MQLVLLNPHVNYCGKMVFNAVFRLAHHQKYTYLWEEALKDQNKKIAFLVDGKKSSFYQTSYFDKTLARIPILAKIFIFFEFWIWILLNRINPLKCRVYFDVKKLNPKSDIIFSFGFTSHQSDLSEYDGIVLVHLSHYHHCTEEVAHYVKSLRYGLLIAENDLTRSAYFRHHFHGAESVYHLPLTFYPGRFKRKVEFNKRINRCFASGAMSVPSAPSYVAYYGKDAALNPMREMIYKNREALHGVVEAYIYPHKEALSELKTVKKLDGFCTKWAKKYLPAWLLKILFNYEFPYFRFDIVEKYNEYTMFMSPEERTGLPSMKLLEGMVCGAAFVGIDDSMYTSIGFKDGVNFIAYCENNLDDLRKKLIYYQCHPKILEAIAQKGYRLAVEQFSSSRVSDVFWHDLEQLLKSFKNGKPHFVSSFVLR